MEERAMFGIGMVSGGGIGLPVAVKASAED